MASSNNNTQLISELRKTAEELRKKAAALRDEKPVVKQAGLHIDKEKLKALIRGA